MIRRRHQPEQEIQRAVVAHLWTRPARGLVWFAVPNGGARSWIEAAIMKGTGTQAGVADLILLHDGVMHALELKAPGGKLSNEQLYFLLAVEAAGGRAAWAVGVDEAIGQLEDWRLLRGHGQGRRRPELRVIK